MYKNNVYGYDPDEAESILKDYSRVSGDDYVQLLGSFSRLRTEHKVKYLNEIKTDTNRAIQKFQAGGRLYRYQDGGMSQDQMMQEQMMQEQGMQQQMQQPQQQQQPQGPQAQSEVQQIILEFAKMQGIDPNQVIEQLKQMDKQQQMEAIQQMAQELQQGQQQQQQPQEQQMQGDPSMQGMEGPQQMRRGGMIKKCQSGGMVNDTGYTVGSDTYSNLYNIIPSKSITMENTDVAIDAYDLNGNKLTRMSPGNNYRFKKRGVIEYKA